MEKEILVVDDEFDDLMSVKNILEKEGFKVTAVTNGAKALDMLTSNGFGVILMDIMMPTLSGYDLLRLLKEKVNHNTKMVYVSIVPKDDVDMDGVDGFIQKPFSPKTLVEGIKKVLEG